MSDRYCKVRDRFNEKWVPVTESGCWLWTATCDSGGDGRIRIAGRLDAAHRVSWEFANGVSPGSAHVLHKCDTPSCVNPQHLRLGTHNENMADRGAKGRCADNRGDKHPRSVIRSSDIDGIRKDERLHREIAADFGVKEAAIYKIKHRITWSHVA